jgi:hypothetical protein
VRTYRGTDGISIAVTAPKYPLSHVRVFERDEIDEESRRIFRGEVIPDGERSYFAKRPGEK